MSTTRKPQEIDGETVEQKVDRALVKLDELQEQFSEFQAIQEELVEKVHDVEINTRTGDL